MGKCHTYRNKNRNKWCVNTVGETQRTVTRTQFRKLDIDNTEMISNKYFSVQIVWGKLKLYKQKGAVWLFL